MKPEDLWIAIAPTSSSDWAWIVIHSQNGLSRTVKRGQEKEYISACYEAKLVYTEATHKGKNDEIKKPSPSGPSD